MAVAAEPIVLANARIHTMDRARPAATSISLRDGRVAAFDAQVGGRTIDLAQATVVPGFVDAHLHLELGGTALMQLDLSGARSRAEFEEAIAEAHRTLPASDWLVATGWNEDAFPDRAPPDRGWLAPAADRPVVCWRSDRHACVVSTAALARIAERHDLSRDPPGGRVARDARGEPTGLLQEAAAWELAVPCIPAPGVDVRRRAVQAAHAHLARLGITSVGSMEYGASLLDAIEPQRASFAVRMRVTLMNRGWPDEFDEWLAFARAFRGDDVLAVIGMKAFVDGTLGSRTARMLDAYADDPDNRGLLVELAERGVLNAWATRVAEAGLSPSMHAIGDEAVRLALDALDAAAARCPAINGRIEHAQTVAPEDLPRFRGRFTSMQPLHKAYDARSAESRFGPARMDRFFPFRSLLRHGARLAFGSDWPIVSADPISSLATAIAGRDVDGRVVRAEENLDAIDALRGYTSGAAECLGMDDAGVLRVGAHADLVVLDRDPLACDWNDSRPRVLATLMGGRPTFVAPELAGVL